MTDTHKKTKHIIYCDTKLQKDTINNGYSSDKYRNKTITTKSKNQLKTRDSTKIESRKKNYKKYQNNYKHFTDFDLDKSIEQNEIYIENNKRELLNINDIINNKLDNITVEDEWIIC